MHSPAWLWWLVNALFVSFVYAEGPTANASDQTIADVFPQLSGLASRPQSPLPLSLGGQNMDHCCALAVNDSLSFVNGLLVLKNVTSSIIIATDLDGLRSGQFPCAASFQGGNQGAPLVKISYRYCRQRCKGWQISKNSRINDWVSPFVGFVIPAIVFCLAIPRRRKLNIPDTLFDVPPGEVASAIRVVVMVPAAATIAAIDTIQWLVTIFALAGPILLSGIYEAVLDSRLLEYLDEKMRNNALSTAQRAHLLLVILVGNLDMMHDPSGQDDTAWSHIDRHGGLLHNLRRGVKSVNEDGPDDSSVGVIINDVTIEALSKDVARVGAQFQEMLAAQYKPGTRSVIRYADDDSEFQTAPGYQNIKSSSKDVEKIKTQLRTMLAAQYSFGVTVGAPIVFFCGSFLYTLIDNYTHFGSNNVSHALAFGLWWMTVPHISIISGLLLAGNNPNTLEGILGEPVPEEEVTMPDERHIQRFVAFVYDSRYRPAWIWNRGRSKRFWAKRLNHVWEERYGKSSTVPTANFYQKALHMGLSDWCWIFFLAYCMILIPSLLAFLTAWYTPFIGLGCRSMTVLVYMLCQLVLIALWIIDIESSRLDENGIPQTPYTQTPFKQGGRKPPWRSRVWYAVAIITGLVSTFITIGGTMMQIMGVFRNCLCSIPISQWHNPWEAFLDISSNSAEDIHYARRTWTSLGAAAVTFLGIVSFIGWWYHKRLRYQMRRMIGSIGKNPQDWLEATAGLD